MPLMMITSQVKQGLRTVSEGAGMDLERSLMNGIGDQLYYGSFPLQSQNPDAEPEQGFFFGVELKDAQSVDMALGALMDSMGHTGV